MTIEKMTVHKALAELKVLDSRIDNAICGAQFCNTVRHCFDKINGKKIADVKVDMKADYDKCTDLIKRSVAIKKAVTLSNAKTTVIVNGETMTVAEAIWMKSHGIDAKKDLLDEMTEQYNNSIALINNTNGEKLTQKAETYIQNTFGTKENLNTDELITARDEYIKKNTLDFIEGFNLKEAIENLKQEIDSFTSEIDAALSVSNAVTEIEITY